MYNGASAGLLLVASALLASGCHPTTLGRRCELPVGADGGVTVINDQALECRSRLCLQQAPEPDAVGPTDTGPLCTEDCRTDADCEPLEFRGDSPGDRRCRRGFVCGVPFATGTVACCRKLCLCRDFLGASVPPPPAVCEDPERSGACGRAGAH